MLAPLRRPLEIRYAERAELLLIEPLDVDLPVGRADDLLEIGARDDVSRDRIEYVIEPCAGADLVANRAQKLQRVGDPPTRRRIDEDELTPERRNLADVAVPGEQPPVEAADVLNERHSPVQPGFRDYIADRLAELNENALLGLIDYERGAERDECRDDERNYR